MEPLVGAAGPPAAPLFACCSSLSRESWLGGALNRGAPARPPRGCAADLTTGGPLEGRGLDDCGGGDGRLRCGRRLFDEMHVAVGVDGRPQRRQPAPAEGPLEPSRAVADFVVRLAQIADDAAHWSTPSPLTCLS